MQRGSIRRWGNNWQLKYRETVIENGVEIRKDRYKNLAPFGGNYRTKESVQALADLILAPLNAGMGSLHSVDSVTVFLEAFVTRGEGGRGNPLRSSTLAGYNTLLRLIKPHLPNIELRQVRTPHIDKLLRQVSELDGADKRASTTYRNLKNFLSSAFRYAVRNGLIDFNPVRDAAIPRGADSDTHAYTLEEIHEIVKVVKPVHKAVILLMMLTGLRGEEVKGLRWEDWDQEQKLLHVQRGVVQGKVVDVKTKASKAGVPVVDTVASLLRKLRDGKHGFIFHGDTDEPLVLENIARRDIAPVLKKAGLEWHGFHACRRGLATVLHELGTPELTIKHILRHSTNDVTSKHYISPSLKASRAALQKVEARYKKVAKTKPRR